MIKTKWKNRRDSAAIFLAYKTDSCKWLIAVYCLCLQVSRYENQSILLGFSVSGFGFFALALLPVGLELGVECTYPVAEATSAALLWLFG